MIPAGTFNQAGKLELFDDEDHFASTSIGFMRLPVTSVKGYASFVKQVAGTLRRPPFGIVTKVKVVPDPKSQFKVVFEPIMSLPDELMSAIMARHEEAMSTIDFPYKLEDEEERNAKSSRNRSRGAASAKGTAAKGTAAKGTRARKY